RSSNAVGFLGMLIHLLLSDIIIIHQVLIYVSYLMNIVLVTVHTPLSREVFWHEYAKIPRHTSQNFIAAGNLE
ncbi:MAG: hypothetical protein U0O03_11995, partial [Blautia wexlerae]